MSCFVRFLSLFVSYQRQFDLLTQKYVLCVLRFFSLACFLRAQVNHQGLLGTMGFGNGYLSCVFPWIIRNPWPLCLIPLTSPFLKISLWLCCTQICHSAWALEFLMEICCPPFHRSSSSSLSPFLERSWLADRVFFLERREESPLMEK